jgi:hypothetical protein
MERPINIFFDLLESIKELVVSVKIGNAKATLNGAVLAQLSESSFKVKDDKGNEGVCKLVNKSVNELKNNEMSIKGYVLKSSAFVFINTVVNTIITDFNNISYFFDVDYDSTANIMLLTEKG